VDPEAAENVVQQRSWDEVIPLSWMALSSSFVSTGQQDGHPRR